MTDSRLPNIIQPMFSLSMVVAANSREVLQDNLLRSGEANLAKEIFVHWGAQSAAEAFNAELSRCTGDVVVFVHQDVFLPKGWTRKMMAGIERLFDQDPNWAVAGCFGITASGRGAGILYSSGLRRFVGEFFEEPIQVRTLDEVLLILNRNSELQFDMKLPGFHLYGTDLCLEAERTERKNYVIPCFLLHNSIGINRLPFSFWKAYAYLRKKWRHRLPVNAPCTKITSDGLPIIEDVIKSIWASMRKRNRLENRLVDPERFYTERIKGTVNKYYREL